MEKNINLSADNLPLDARWIYKIAPAPAWAEAAALGQFDGSALDLADGYIHLSPADQVAGTLARWFPGESDLVLVSFDPNGLGEALRWERARGGVLFPHLYAPLPTAAAIEVVALDWDGARHQAR